MPLLRSAALLLVLGLSPAWAQHAGLAPSEASRLRPLAERLEQADAVAAGTVTGVEVGRIRIESARVWLGELPEDSFELKRAPARPPPLAPGDRALLLLRGARSPYLLVDAPHELVRLEDAQAEALWRRAIEQSLAAEGDPARRRALHLAWLDSSDPALRLVGERELTHPEPPLADAALSRLVSQALDPDLHLDRRRAALRIALQSPAGADALLPALPGAPDVADAEILREALRSAVSRADPRLDALLARALLHPGEDVRRTALTLSLLAARGPLARPALEQVAEGDPVQELRAKARRALDSEGHR